MVSRLVDLDDLENIFSPTSFDCSRDYFPSYFLGYFDSDADRPFSALPHRETRARQDARDPLTGVVRPVSDCSAAQLVRTACPRMSWFV